MEIKQCFLTNNITYKKAVPAEMKGIVVHSTGANQRYLWRWVQPSDDDPNKDAILKDIGKNYNNNSWNKSNVDTIVHYMIGYNANDEVRVYQTMPLDYCCGGVANGLLCPAGTAYYAEQELQTYVGTLTEEMRGYNWTGKPWYSIMLKINGKTYYAAYRSGLSYNYNPNAHIQFEMLEDNHKDEAYFRKVVGEGVKLCAYLCKQYGFTPDDIVSHNETFLRGYGSHHGDPENWLKDFGMTMDDFRKAVKEEMGSVTVFKRGDIVGIKPGVTQNINKDELKKWVYDGRDLWVYSSDETRTKITIDKTLKQVTATMRTSDLYLKESVSEPENVTVPKEEYDKLVADKIALQTAYDNICNSYDELSNDYETVRKERDTLRETALDLKEKIDNIREIVQ